MILIWGEGRRQKIGRGTSLIPPTSPAPPTLSSFLASAVISSYDASSSPFLVPAQSSPVASAPRHEAYPLCRLQDPLTVGVSHRPSLPDPPPPSLQVWQ